MKTKLLLIAFFCLNITYGQDITYFDINFDIIYGLNLLHVDTISNENNIWEIGTPDKTMFDSAYSHPNAICTDLNKPYPVNDTSVFYVKKLACLGFAYQHTVILAGKYKIDADSLNDYGKLEFSPDNGLTWINLIKDTIYNECYYWGTVKPVFTGTNNEWTYFRVSLAPVGYYFDIGGYENNDTVIYKFTFISDSIQTNQDGWILDDLHFEDWVEAINETDMSTIKSTTYPNPAKRTINIKFSNANHKKFIFSIYDTNGDIIHREMTRNEIIKIDLHEFTQGVYFYRILSKDEVSSGQFVKM